MAKGIQTVGVVGAGTMGAGIAQVAAQAGKRVILVDLTEDLLARATARIDKGLKRLVEKERLTDGDRQSALARIETSTDPGRLAPAGLVVEAVVEDRGAKRDLLARLDALLPAETILASNTSSISITDLAAATRRPDRFVGMHFMNPVPVMALVEIIRGLITSEATVEAAAALAAELGKTPVVVADSPGFVVNRLLIPMINEAAYVVSEGIASADHIDKSMTLGCNFPMGPLALADLIGLDVVLAIMEVLNANLGDPKYRPCPLLRAMVAAGRLGRKTGRGFFDYQGK
jgi:3-hydroxybutyryl-CoA dehydrogenase